MARILWLMIIFGLAFGCGGHMTSSSSNMISSSLLNNNEQEDFLCTKVHTGEELNRIKNTSLTSGRTNQVKYFRVTFGENTSQEMNIIWHMVNGSSKDNIVYYGPTSQNNPLDYPCSIKTDTLHKNYRGMNTAVAKLTALTPDTVFYFMVGNTSGHSQQFSIHTLPNRQQKLSIISGGDSRNNRTTRQQANSLVAKLRPHFVTFAGDMTGRGTSLQWHHWFEDWQKTIGSDGRITPIVVARGNHEPNNDMLEKLFHAPKNIYYARSFANDLLKIFTLNTEISMGGNQRDWLEQELLKSSAARWKMAQYHRPIRPHTIFKVEGTNQYRYWAPLFYKYRMDLVVESDTHMVKTTWPVRPFTGSGSNEGFIRDDSNGMTFIGEGTWGAPLRSDNDKKAWTRASGRFNQIKWIFVSKNKIEIRSVVINNKGDALRFPQVKHSEIGQLSDNDRFKTPDNLVLWKPTSGEVVVVN